MKKGFTLIELLAVIVILAIIALITIPAVLRMTDNAKVSSYRRSVDLYGKAVSQAVVSYESDMIEKGQTVNIEFNTIDSYIDYDGNDVECDEKIIYSDRTVFISKCKVDGNLVEADKNGYEDGNYYYYYTNAKKSIKSIKYIEAVNEAIDNKNISGECIVESNDKIKCGNVELEVKSKLENPSEGKIEIKNNKVVSYSDLKFKDQDKESSDTVAYILDETGTNQQVSTYKGYSVGDKITYDNTDYYVIENSNKNQDYVVLLKDIPLTADEVTSLDTEHAKVNGYHSPERYTRTGSGLAVISYYTSTGCYMSDHHGGSPVDCKTNYNESDIKYVVDEWSNKVFTHNELKEINGYKSRLITKQELERLSGEYTWKTVGSSNQSGYWTMSSDSYIDDYGYKYVYEFNNNGKIEKSVVYYSYSVRPVINLNKSAIN